MPSFAEEMIAKRRAAAAAGLIATPQPEGLSSPATTQATGMASQVEMHGLSRTPQFVPIFADDEDYDIEKASKSLGVYKNVDRIRSFIKPKGGKVRAVNDFFYPETEEEVAMLEDYVSRKQVKKIILPSTSEE